MSVLLGADDTPLVPSSVVDELKALSPRLGLEYHTVLQSFVLTLAWAEGDERWRYVQEGQMSPHAAKTILTNVPANVSLDELRGWVAARLRQVGRSNDEVRRMIDAEETRIAAHNAQVSQQHEAAAMEAVLSEASSGKTINVGRRRTKVTPE
ncbi:hypothetical protein [Gemmatimonas sp.]|jgi:hypothetical protein|uniref:hypothetical protein n=1 Tax=Gemmatimonas sp. TaxID=1962908 RepID=UPI00391F2B24